MLNDLTSDLKTTRDPRQLAKLKHVQACLMPESQYQKSAGFMHIELEHQACAALSLDDISLSTMFFGKRLQAPLMIAPMTGGVELGATLNRRWAQAAEQFGIAFGVGSQRLMMNDARVASTFHIRPYAKNAFIFGNLGAAQIKGNDGVEMARRAVDSIAADALFLHLNPLQEACQQGGDTNFSSVLDNIALVSHALKKDGIPVLVREVGFGLSKKAVRDLLATGIVGLDCSGAGGTSWTKVEALCATDEIVRKRGMTFGEWGIPTTQSIKNVRAVDRDVPLIASGGLRSGLDLAKAIALGADLGAMAQPMLKAAIESEEALGRFIEQTLYELKTAMFAAGMATIADLKSALK